MKKYSIIASVFMLALLAVSCVNLNISGLKGTGRIVKESRFIGPVSGVEIDGNADVFFTEGESDSVIVETDDNMADRVELSVSGGILRVETSGIGKPTFVKVYVKSRNAKSFVINGSGSITCGGNFQGEYVKFEVSGSGDIAFANLNSKIAKIDVSGSGSVNLAGATEALKVSSSGSGHVRCAELKSDYANIDLSGSGDAYVNAAKELYAETSGSGDITYSGRPQVLKTTLSGSGKIRQK